MGAKPTKLPPSPPPPTTLPHPYHHHEISNPYGDPSLLRETLLDIVCSAQLKLSFVRRLALYEAIARQPLSTDAFVEGIITCPSITAMEKGRILNEGVAEHHWDRLRSYYKASTTPSTITTTPTTVVRLPTEFLNYRRMIMALIRTSRRFQPLPDRSRQRLRSMILSTQTHVDLDHLLTRVVQRMFTSDIQIRILHDVAQQNYHRLLWSDRLDCDEGCCLYHYSDDQPSNSKLFETIGTQSPVGGGGAGTDAGGILLLENDLSSRRQEQNGDDTCPICLTAVHAPAVQLSCQHAFCSKCIFGWIKQETTELSSLTSSSTAAPDGWVWSKRPTSWHCPVCRHSY